MWDCFPTVIILTFIGKLGETLPRFQQHTVLPAHTPHAVLTMFARLEVPYNSILYHTVMSSSLIDLRVIIKQLNFAIAAKTSLDISLPLPTEWDFKYKLAVMQFLNLFLDSLICELALTNSLLTNRIKLKREECYISR